MHLVQFCTVVASGLLWCVCRWRQLLKSQCRLAPCTREFSRRRLLRLAGPVSLQASLSFSSSLVSLAFAGHISETALSQAVLALSLYNISAASVVVGLAQGLETLCSQVRSSGLLVAGPQLACQDCLVLALTLHTLHSEANTSSPPCLGSPDPPVGAVALGLQGLERRGRVGGSTGSPEVSEQERPTPCPARRQGASVSSWPGCAGVWGRQLQGAGPSATAGPGRVQPGRRRRTRCVVAAGPPAAAGRCLTAAPCCPQELTLCSWHVLISPSVAYFFLNGAPVSTCMRCFVRAGTVERLLRARQGRSGRVVGLML